MFIFIQQNSGQNYITKMVNKSFENVENLKIQPDPVITTSVYAKPRL